MDTSYNFSRGKKERTSDMELDNKLQQAWR